ncbi:MULTISPECIES: hypothetical protein [unclassified Ensifer]|uniref:hypothetical protein n=1 Tax=unclassified Ensifer TaxID=2633371 RepID=UPI000886B89F|nr:MULTISPECIES: hypothetical protein [unclassified Ensifer]MBD9569041.1 hypothetical protein [Ensifer sp. ENS08]SDN84917.1 F-type H+-transporting ATPase subunit b [Ensifer sp. YR511]
MKIQMLVGLAGNEYSLAPGDEREFPHAEAVRLIDAGFAAPVDVQPTEKRSKRGKNVVSDESGNGGDD